jgi:hypothetical protein
VNTSSRVGINEIRSCRSRFDTTDSQILTYMLFTEALILVSRLMSSSPSVVLKEKFSIKSEDWGSRHRDVDSNVISTRQSGALYQTLLSLIVHLVFYF